jgi:hypothetical protein
MFASVIGRFLAADPGHLLIWIGATLANFAFAGADLFCLLALLRSVSGGGEE